MGLDKLRNPMLIVEEREGGLFLHPAATVPMRDIPKAKIQAWIARDEADFHTRLGREVYGLRIATPGEFLVEQRAHGVRCAASFFLAAIHAITELPARGVVPWRGAARSAHDAAVRAAFHPSPRDTTLLSASVAPSDTMPVP